MKKIILILCASIPAKVLAADANTISNELITCNVRLSNVVVRSSISNDPEVTFCSGTIVGSNLIATSAHCVNQTGSRRVSSLADIPEDLNFNVAVGTAVNSQNYTVRSGAEGAVYADTMATLQSREGFLSRRTLSLVKDDLVILRLNQPVQGVDSSICPQLPTVAECAELAAFIKAPARNLSQIASSFYLSNYYTVGDGAARQKYPYPSTRIANVQASFFARDVAAGFLGVEFNIPPITVTIHQGDSGTGLLWKKSGMRKLLLGTQSAALKSFAGRALFSDMCRFTGHRNWPAN